MEDFTASNNTHLARLLVFLEEVLLVCSRIGIQPVLCGSLAVLFHTRNSAVDVNDVDLACHEQDLDRLSMALTADGIDCRLRAWHVLQARRGDLKIDFDSIEHWMSGLSGERKKALIGTCSLLVVGQSDRTDLYRRGLAAPEAAKHAATAAMHELLAS